MENPWQMLTPQQAAKQLGVSEAATRRYFKSGILRGKTHGRYILLEQRSVLALLKVIQWAREGKPTPPTLRKVKAASFDANDAQADGIVLWEDADEGKAI